MVTIDQTVITVMQFLICASGLVSCVLALMLIKMRKDILIERDHMLGVNANLRTLIDFQTERAEKLNSLVNDYQNHNKTLIEHNETLTEKYEALINAFKTKITILEQIVNDNDSMGESL